MRTSLIYGCAAQVNFGSLAGFVVAYELSSRRRPPSFATWAQDNGHAMSRKLNSSAASENHPKNDSEDSMETRTNGDDVEHKNLLKQYEEARANLLAALVGEVVVFNMLILVILGLPPS